MRWLKRLKQSSREKLKLQTFIISFALNYTMGWGGVHWRARSRFSSLWKVWPSPPSMAEPSSGLTWQIEDVGATPGPHPRLSRPALLHLPSDPVLGPHAGLPGPSPLLLGSSPPQAELRVAPPRAPPPAPALAPGVSSGSGLGSHSQHGWLRLLGASPY